MKLIEKYFPELSPTQRQRFENLETLYNEWNNKINVISRNDIQHLYLRHILHSLAIAKYIKFKPGTRILDVGTGGGFPGIPLAIFFPQSFFLLIDSIGKKITVVNAIIESLKLENCEAIKCRAEELDGKFDFIISRAVASLDVFIPWVKDSIVKKSVHGHQKGILYLKGGDLNEELDIPFSLKVTTIRDYFDEPFFSGKKIIHIFLP